MTFLKARVVAAVACEHTHGRWLFFYYFSPGWRVFSVSFQFCREPLFSSELLCVSGPSRIKDFSLSTLMFIIWSVDPHTLRHGGPRTQSSVIAPLEPVTEKTGTNRALFEAVNSSLRSKSKQLPQCSHPTAWYLNKTA